MLTQVLSVLHINRWVELPGTSQGVILQRLSGAKLYYRYADERPHDDIYLGFLEGGGVKLASIDVFKSRATATRIIRVPVPDRTAAIAAGMAQLNKPYDYTAIAGILANKRRWQEDDMWFCTELCAFVVQSGGALYFPPADIPLITPQRLLVALSKPCPKYA